MSGPTKLLPHVALSVSSSNRHRFEVCLWALVFYLDLFCVSVNKICPKVCEKPNRGYFLDLRIIKKFPYKLMLIAPLLYIILAYERCHRNVLLLGSGGKPVFSFWTWLWFLLINKCLGPWCEKCRFCSQDFCLRVGMWNTKFVGGYPWLSPKALLSINFSFGGNIYTSGFSFS